MHTIPFAPKICFSLVDAALAANDSGARRARKSHDSADLNHSGDRVEGSPGW